MKDIYTFYVLKCKNQFGVFKVGDFYYTKYTGDEYSDSYEDDPITDIFFAKRFDSLDNIRLHHSFYLKYFDVIKVSRTTVTTTRTKKVVLK